VLTDVTAQVRRIGHADMAARCTTTSGTAQEIAALLN
jgi:hypothetical protein